MKSHPPNRLVYLFLLLLTIVSCSHKTTEVSIFAPITNPEIEFAVDELDQALASRGVTLKKSDDPGATIALSIIESDTIRHEGFEIASSQEQIQVSGIDLEGLMYGGLELAEQIRLYGIKNVKPTLQNPYMEMRGPKFNIPLDVRTPSYSDASDAGQNNIPIMWDIDFWKEYIDTMARYRYNYISLWSLHPFPSLVKVPGYEDIALDDIKRSTGEWKELYNLNGIGMGDAHILDSTETVKKITIDEKIDFWKSVMAYGKQRNIDFHLITWNIFDYGTEGKYGITDEMDNEVTKDYYRKSIKQLFVTYPDLVGIGLTTGENMKIDGKRTSAAERENWAYDTYAQGILDAAKEMPDRQFTFIHRQHQTGAKEIAEKFKPVIDTKNVEFLYCFKYAKAHIYSATEQPYHEQDNFIEDIQGMKTIWGLRNDDTYYFRWGAPDFVREFIGNMPHEVAKGIYFGSDQWIWGRDFLTKDSELSGELEIKKHWYQWLLWGRLSYNPEINNERFKALLADRFPNTDAEKLQSAWQQASMVYPVTTGFHWGRLDFQWYIEGCLSHPKPAENETGFNDVNRFISLGIHPKSGNQTIPDYVQMMISDSTTTLTTPLQVSLKLHELSDGALKELETLTEGTSKELAHTLNDIKTVSYLGKYYAHKIAGSTYLALYRETKDTAEQKKAVDELTTAFDFWKEYTAQALQRNTNPLWTNRVGHVDWKQITEWVAEDIEIANEKLH
ncbi:carbohydrate-binding family 6 protein [Aggregatimonas sangjinii]|uniref:Carbohydrate-binding family 6 protein n=1 Tax=Aggregatimonas sangjinii TaxID=2583587 RepID=A0A5B7SRC8_9FLAO|nr:carbohydrate-binding family 6 protein [Aggregatimonas sangjinii]QCW99550.1 carbohydrate-binding family 6 protein [Aggregatimonas sangjinii]